ncbi:MAG: PspC domain-containing protein [Actinomycetota bacterium]
MTSGNPAPIVGERPPPRRVADGRVAGVAGGLGPILGIQPGLVRFGFILLTFIGGAGMLLYLGGWLLLLPPEPTTTTGARPARRPTLLVIIGGGLLTLGILVGLATLNGIDWTTGIIVALLFAGIVVLNRPSAAARSRLAAPPAPQTPPPPQPPPFAGPPPSPGPAVPPAPAETEGTAPTPSEPLAATPPADEPRSAPPPPEPLAATPPADEPRSATPSPEPLAEPLAIADPALGAMEANLGRPIDDRDDQGRAHWALTRTIDETSLAESNHPPAAGPPLASLTLAALAVVTGLALVLNTLATVPVGVTTVAGIGVALVGLAVAISAFTGGTGRLIPLAVLSLLTLAAAPILSLIVDGGAGSRSITVTSVDQLQSDYRLGVGYLELDLGRLAIIEDTDIEVEVGVGSLEITVPGEVNVELRASNEVGSIWLIDREETGIDLTFTRLPGDADPDRPTLRIHTDMRIGDTSVYQRFGTDG